MDDGLRRLHEAITSATETMNSAQLSFHLPGKWSAAEVLEHLYLTYKGTVKGCEKCLTDGKPFARKPLLSDRVRAAVVVRFGYMPEGRKAPERSIPKGMLPEDVAGAIGPELLTMDNLISQCEARFGKRTRLMDHPVLGPLTAVQWRQFHSVHGQHHMKQIRALQQQSAAIVPEAQAAK